MDPIVTLTTDFGWKDHYTALIKGGILQRCPSTQFVDVSHHIEPYNIVQAAYVLRNAYGAFPKGSIHLLSVNDYGEEGLQFLAVRHDGHYFIGPNNGVFSLLFSQKPEHIYQLHVPKRQRFPIRSIMAKAVEHIVAEQPFHEIGLPVKQLVERLALQPVVSHSQLRATVIYIDHYENVVLNVQRDDFERVAHDRAFELYFKRHDPIRHISQNYSQVPVGEVLCLFNSADHLEIAVNMGKAASLLGLSIDDTIQIDFV